MSERVDERTVSAFSDALKKAANETLRIIEKHDQVPDVPRRAYFNGFIMGAQFGRQFAQAECNEKDHHDR